MKLSRNALRGEQSERKGAQKTPCTWGTSEYLVSPADPLVGSAALATHFENNPEEATLPSNRERSFLPWRVASLVLLLSIIMSYRATAQSLDQMQENVSMGFDQALAQCYAIVGQMPWENERIDGTGPDEAFNCRDFTRWFIECMERLGHPGVVGLSVSCSDCDSKRSYAHRIALYRKPNGMWCPGEPQKEEGGEYTSCCNEKQGVAARCAARIHCDEFAKRDACCNPGKTWITDPTTCKAEKCCYEEIDADGVSHLACDLPVIGILGGCPVPAAPPTPTLSPEQQRCLGAITACLETKSEGDECLECRRKKLPECNDSLPEPPMDGVMNQEHEQSELPY